MTTKSAANCAVPTGGEQRHSLIDALRGFALAGVLLVNLGTFTQYDFLESAARLALPTAGFDAFARMAIQVVAENKAITLFSLLFGLGFSLQMERAAANGRDGLGLFRRRIAVLGLFGLLHCYLLWWGDILLIYALMALVLMLFRKASDRVLLAGGLLIALVLPPLLQPWLDAALSAQAAEEVMAATNLAAFGSPSYMVAMRQNAVFANWAWLSYWGVFFFVAGRFLLGYWAGRRRLLQDPAAHRVQLQRLCAWGLAVGIAITALDEADVLQASPAASAGWQFCLRVLRRIGPLALATGYAASFALLYQRERWRWLQVLAPVGRMALSNYLVQTLACTGIFYGFGLGIGPRYGYAGWLLAWAVLFGAQVAFSHWWLARFRFGPMEWLWRSLTYARPQPMRRSAVG